LAPSSLEGCRNGCLGVDSSPAPKLILRAAATAHPYERVVEALRSRHNRRRAEGLTSTRFARFVGLGFATHPRKLLQERLRRTRQQYDEDLEAGARQAPRPARWPGVSERGVMGKAGGHLRQPVFPEAAQEVAAEPDAEARGQGGRLFKP
jgi:hypothetical protein